MDNIERRIKFLDKDAKHYPANDPTGFYTTFDIIRIFPDIKMEKLQDWIKREFIKPVFRVEVARGLKSYFVHSQLYMIAVFKKAVDMGISRERASRMIYGFHKLRVDFLKTNGDEPIAVIIEPGEQNAEPGEQNDIKSLSILPKGAGINLENTTSDMIIINLAKVHSAIENYSG
jgi:hypothetical protein